MPPTMPSALLVRIVTRLAILVAYQHDQVLLAILPLVASAAPPSLAALALAALALAANAVLVAIPLEYLGGGVKAGV